MRHGTSNPLRACELGVLAVREAGYVVSDRSRYAHPFDAV